jgi:uncharacterized protein (TIGR04255 family)
MLVVPEPPRFRMTAAPLVQALVQVNFPITPRLQSLEGVVSVQEALGDRFPYLNQSMVQQMSLMVGPTGPAAPQTTQQTVHELTSDDGWTLTLTVSSATLSVGAEYAGVTDFAERFTEVCAALSSAARVPRCDRLGVRYLDIVEIGDSEDAWGEWFRPEIVGVAAPAVSGSALISSLTESRLQQPPEGPFGALQSPVEGILRHGVVPAGSVVAGVPPRPIEQRSFVLDMDTFVVAAQPFAPDALADQFQALHSEVEKIFHWAVTERGKVHFGYQETEGEDEQ